MTARASSSPSSPTRRAQERLADYDLTEEQIKTLVETTEVTTENGRRYVLCEPEEPDHDPEFEHNKAIADEVSRRCGGLTSDEYRRILYDY